MGMFDKSDDPLGGAQLTPSPMLDPLGVSPQMLDQALPPGPPPQAPLPRPVPPSAPAQPGAMQNILQMALLGLSAGLGPHNALGRGIAGGVGQTQHEGEALRQVQFHNQQTQYQQQQQEFLRQDQMAQQQARYEAQQQAQRQQAFQQALTSIRNEVKTLPDKATYDKRIEGFAGILQGSGYRLDANWLRQAVPYIAPSGKQKAEAALKAFFANPLTVQQLKDDPNAVANGSMQIDLNDDGVAEVVPIRKVMEAAGQSMLADDQGNPLALAPGTQGDMKHVALQQMIAQFRAENRRAPDAKEMLKLVADAAKVGQRPPSVSGGSGASSDDVSEIVSGIADGSQPPTLSGLYRNTAAVRAGLHRQGYDLTAATQDWEATKKFMSTANGSQQTKMRQSVDNAYHSLDVIESLAEQWAGGRFPPLNKARLAAAKNGAMGQDAQKIATLLDAQISDVTSELGNVYMGGNSPTDHALSLAAQNLSADWALPQLKAAINQSRNNLRIRQNSMKNTGPVSMSGRDNAYAPAPAPSGDVEFVRDPKTGKMTRKP